MWNKYSKKYLTIVVFLCLLTACSGTQQTVGSQAVDNPYKGTPEADMVTIDIQTEPSELNSMLTADSVANIILQMNMSGLLKFDHQDMPQAGIAESWNISEDFRIYTFYLREDASWTNGDPVTAYDFQYAWTRIMEPTTASPIAHSLYDIIKNGKLYYQGMATKEDLGIRVLDDYTLEVEFEHPSPNALSLFASTMYFPVNQKAYETIGADAYAKDVDNIVSNGAYTITSWTHDDHILMEKNEAYFEADSIYVPKVKYMMINDANARMNAFRAGQIDVIDLIGEQIPQMESEGQDIVHKYYDNAVFMFQYNKERPVIDNPKISKALALSVDIKSLCDNLFKDGSIEAQGYVPPTISGIDGKTFAEARTTSYKTYDVEAAKSLLEGGLKELGMDKSQLKLTYTASDSVIGRLQGEYFQQQWATNLGIQVEINLVNFKTYVDLLQNGDFDFTFVGYNGENNPISYLQNFRSDNASNYGSYKSIMYDDYLTQAIQESDLRKRQELMLKAEVQVQDDAAIMPLYYTRIVYATSSKVTGITCTALQKYNFTNGAKLLP